MERLLKKFRRDLHRIPETGLDLPETAAYLEKALAGLPCRVFSPIPGGAAAWFDFGREETVALRADMDALPLGEETGLPFASRRPGRMHACGHDGHMAIALGTAVLASRQKSPPPRNLLILFQPGEETGGGGERICRAGVLREHRVSRIYGLHLWPGLPAGAAAGRPGPQMAATCEVRAEFTGRSRHIALPEKGGDALLAGAEYLLRAYGMERDALPPESRRLLRFGRMESGSAHNAVSGRTLLQGGLRAFSPGEMALLKDRLRELGEAVGKEAGCGFSLSFDGEYPPVVNHPGLFAEARGKLPGLIPLEEPVLAAEDFAFYQREVPGLFLFLGTGRKEPLHSPRFDFDEAALAAGVELCRRLLELG